MKLEASGSGELLFEQDRAQVSFLVSMTRRGDCYCLLLSALEGKGSKSHALLSHLHIGLGMLGHSS